MCNNDFISNTNTIKTTKNTRLRMKRPAVKISARTSSLIGLWWWAAFCDMAFVLL